MTNPWLAHVAEFKNDHPEMKYKEVLVEAKKTYKKMDKRPSSGRPLKKKDEEDISEDKTVNKAQRGFGNKIKLVEITEDKRRRPRKVKQQDVIEQPDVVESKVIQPQIGSGDGPKRIPGLPIRFLSEM